MATPTGLRQSSRDLGFPPQEQGQAQESMPDLPPGFTYTQLESMIRELRTAAALEVQPCSLSCVEAVSFDLPAHACPSVCLLVYLSVCLSLCVSVCLCLYLA